MPSLARTCTSRFRGDDLGGGKLARCEGQGVADDVRALRTPSTAPSISRGQHGKTLDFGLPSTSGPDCAVDDARIADGRGRRYRIEMSVARARMVAAHNACPVGRRPLSCLTRTAVVARRGDRCRWIDASASRLHDPNANRRFSARRALPHGPRGALVHRLEAFPVAVRAACAVVRRRVRFVELPL